MSKIFMGGNYKLSCERDIILPRMMTLEQIFERTTVSAEDAAREETERIMRALPVSETELDGRSVALTAGSRGIKNIAAILRAVAEVLKSRGASPFVVPAMGSHGGATAKGQEQVLQDYGVTEESVGVPVRSSMEVVRVTLSGVNGRDMPVFCDRLAWEADRIVPIGRVKPHSDFKAEIESGLCKMMAIGLGKHEGAKMLHQNGFDLMSQAVTKAAEALIDSGRVLFGLAVLENAYDETMKVEAVVPSEIVEREKILLREAKAAMGRLMFDSIDILLVDLMGKDINGAGMDPNVTGRTITGQPGFTAPPIQNVAVLDLTEHSQGNAVGVGVADVVTRRLAQKIDFDVTYTNSITAASLVGCKLPMVARDDKDALLAAYCVCHRVSPETVKIVHIRSTSDLNVVEASENLKAQVEAEPYMRILSEAIPFEFRDGRLLSRLNPAEF